MTSVDMTSTETSSSPIGGINVPALQEFNANEITKYGNQVLDFVLRIAEADEEYKSIGEQLETARQNGSFQLMQALMHMHETDEKFNIFAIFEGGKAVERLNTRILTKMGVITRVPDPDGENIITQWSNEQVRDQYAYSLVDKEKDPKEYKRRFDNRKRLNIAFSNAAKAAIALIDNGTKADEVKFVEQDGAVRPVIEKAPAEITGETKGPVTFGERKVATGAKMSPTLSSLVKLASDKHKQNDDGSEGAKERSDKGADRSGDAKLAMTDELFGSLVNNLKRAIAAQEGLFTEDMHKQMKSLVEPLNEAIALGVAPKQVKVEEADEASDEKAAKPAKKNAQKK